LHPMPINRCLTFVFYPGAVQIISNASIGLTLMLRTYALYHGNKYIFAILVPFYFVSVAVESWAIAGGAPVPVHPGAFSGCILTGRAGTGDRIAALWMSQLVFATLVFVLTTTRILRLKRQGHLGTRSNSIAELMLRDGTLYFFVIFFVNLLNVLTYVFAPTDLQAVNASFSSILQGIMISRLMLNLRGGMNEAATVGGTIEHWHAGSVQLIGNLGADLDIGDESTSNDTNTDQDSLRQPWRSSFTVMRGPTAWPINDRFLENGGADCVRSMASRT